MHRNPNPTLFASIYSFYLHNMLLFCPVFMPISLYLPCLFVVCPSHVRLGFFSPFFDMPWTCIWYDHVLMHRCCGVVRSEVNRAFAWTCICLRYDLDLALMNMNNICECFALNVITCLFNMLNMPLLLVWIWYVCLVIALNMMI